MTNVTTGVWLVRCPFCQAAVDVMQYDAGQYHGIEVEVDCTACKRSFYTDTVVLIVSGPTLEEASRRAAGIAKLARAEQVPDPK